MTKRKILLILAVICAFVIALHVSITSAASPTPSPSPKTSPKPTASTTPTSSAPPEKESTVKQNIKDRIEKVLDENQTPATQKKRAYVGRVERVTTDFLNLQTLKGSQTVKLNDGKTAVLQLPKLTPVQLQDVEIGGFAIAMGYMNGDDVLEARRILISPTALFPTPKKVILGTLQDIDTTSLTITARDTTEQKIPLSKKTLYQDNQGETLKKTELQENDQVLVIIQNAENASSSASLVRLMQ